MEFVHQPYIPGDTIAAVATPPGEGGVAIIRISGHEAFDIADTVFSGPVHTYKTHTVHYGEILGADKKRIDNVLLIPMKGKRSYTGEDTVEIHCHGGRLVTAKVLDTVLKAGARAARAGEFTFKAFINGKIDLAQAEAVQELIGAKNEFALDIAEEQLKGSLSLKIMAFQKDLTHVAAILEAFVDFPEEGLEFATKEELCQDLEFLSSKIELLANTFHEGKIAHDGITLSLVGAPNVGKSSLMNALLDKDRAIVSSIAGTTRDVLEDYIRLNGLNFKLMDTAGIRETDEVIEKEGIRRSKEAMYASDLILLVLDASRDLNEDDRWLIERAPLNKTIIVWNKIDIVHSPLPEIDQGNIVSLSAQKKIGLELLHQMIDQVIWKNKPPSKEEVLITRLRHKEALSETVKFIRQVILGLQTDVSPEFLAIDMRAALVSLGTIIGTNITEDLLSQIFSTFCIGK